MTTIVFTFCSSAATGTGGAAPRRTIWHDARASVDRSVDTSRRDLEGIVSAGVAVGDYAQYTIADDPEYRVRWNRRRDLSRGLGALGLRQSPRERAVDRSIARRGHTHRARPSRFLRYDPVGVGEDGL